MARRPKSKSAEGEARKSGPCPYCTQPLYGTPPFCPFCGKEQAVEKAPEAPLTPSVTDRPSSLTVPVEVEAQDLPPAPIPEKLKKSVPVPVSPPVAEDVQEPTSTGKEPSPSPADAPISGAPNTKSSRKQNRNGVIIALVVLGLLFFAVVSRCSSGGEPRRVAHVYDLGNHWMEIETPASGNFALAADAALRIRSGEKTWFIPSNAHALLEGLDPGRPVEVRTIGGRTHVQVLVP